MAMSEESLKEIERILAITQKLDLDDLIILGNAVIVQAGIKTKLKIPVPMLLATLRERFKRREREGYVSPEAKARIEAAILGGG